MTHLNSKPRGNRVQRELHEVAKRLLQGTELRAMIDFSRRGGHQAMKIMRGDKELIRISMASTPRSKGLNMTVFEARLKRELRALGLEKEGSDGGAQPN